ncbi:hypothetical protein F4604DRAFT_1568183, partial [Suillus subluteus]
ERYYNNVVEYCALLPDLNILEDGDDTEIGSRGAKSSVRHAFYIFVWDAHGLQCCHCSCCVCSHKVVHVG